jgi:hypothetical protein
MQSALSSALLFTSEFTWRGEREVTGCRQFFIGHALAALYGPWPRHWPVEVAHELAIEQDEYRTAWRDFVATLTPATDWRNRA